MRLRRPVSAAAVALVAAATLTGPAGAQASGVGTTLTTTKVLTAQVGANGSILDLSLITDEAQATIDSAVAAPGAFSRLTVAKVGSSIVPGSVIANQTIPPVPLEAKSTGPTSVGPGAVDLSAVAPVLTGSVNLGSLTASLNNGVAASGINVEAANVGTAVGGLVSVGSVKSTLGSTAAGDAASGTRGASVSNITVLDLGAVLQGLGVDLTSLSVTQVAALLDSLAATTGLPLPSGQTTVTGAVNALSGALADLRAAVASSPAATTDLLGAIDGTTSTLLTTIGVSAPLPPSGAVLADALVDVDNVIAELDGLLTGLMIDGVKALEGLALLRLEGLEVGINTKAVSDQASSVAAVTGKVGKVWVGNISTDALDVLGAASAITGVLTKVNTDIATVLGSLHPDLANLIKVSVLDKATEITTANGYTKASAGITGATAVVTPPASLAAIVNAINARTTSLDDEVGDVIPAPDLAALGLSTAMSQLQTVLSLGNSVLSVPATIKVAQVLGVSNYRVGAAGTGAPTSPTLPRTGGGGPDPTTLLLAGSLAALFAIAVRRFVRVPAMTPVRSRRDDS